MSLPPFWADFTPGRVGDGVGGESPSQPAPSPPRLMNGTAQQAGCLRGGQQPQDAQQSTRSGVRLPHNWAGDLANEDLNTAVGKLGTHIWYSKATSIGELSCRC